MKRITALLCVLVVLLEVCSVGLSTADSPSDNWSMFKHDPAQTGYTNSSALKANPEVAWSTGYDPKGDFMAVSPVISDGIVYIANSDLSAYNVSNGNVIWSLSDQGYSPPVVANGVIYTYKGAYNASTGVKIWENKEQSLYWVAVVNGYYYTCFDFYTNNNHNYSLVALNASTGKQLWNDNGYYIWKSSPALSNGILCFGQNNGLVAIDAYTGKELWSTPDSSIEISPAIANETVFASGVDGKLFCFDLSSGHLIWTATVGLHSAYSSPAVEYGMVYIGSSDGSICAFNQSNGLKVWSYSNPAINGSADTSPALADGLVYAVLQDGNLYALNAFNGDKLWSYPVGPQPELGSSPAISDGSVFVSSKTTILTVLKEESTVNLFSVEILAVSLIVVLIALLFVFFKRKGFLFEKRSIP
jgi:outer membrane protein assembly factor BamB